MKNITVGQLIDILEDFQKAGFGDKEISSIGCVCAGTYQDMTTPYFLNIRLEGTKEMPLYFPSYQKDIK